MKTLKRGRSIHRRLWTDRTRSRRQPKIYFEVLGLPLTRDPDGYTHTSDLDGTRHFALWPLAQTAQSPLARTHGRSICPSRKDPKATTFWSGCERLGVRLSHDCLDLKVCLLA